MLSQELTGFSACCKNGQAAPCMQACPYGLDVREFIRKIRRGNIRGAYNTLSEKLLFPGIQTAVCRNVCRKSCEAELNGPAIDLPALEKAVLVRIPHRKIRSFRVPQKPEKIAVIGAGLSGVSAAYVLRTLGYSVTVFEKQKSAGTSLYSLLSEETVNSEFDAVFRAGGFSLETEKEITDLSQVGEFDAVVIASGKNGSCFGFDPQKDLLLFQSGRVFIAGRRLGIPLTASADSGKEAAMAADRYLKTGEIRQEPWRTEPSVFSANEKDTERVLTEEEMAEEANRCLLCDCTKCADMCELMREYKKVPPNLEIDIQGTLNPVAQIRKRSATRLIASCDDCGMCEAACPEGIRTREVLMKVREGMAQDKVLPAAFHDFWLRDMAFSCGEEAAFLRKPENGVLFFPGCLLGASDPELVLTGDRLVRKCLPGSGLWLFCCGIPAKWAGETKLFEEHLQKIRNVWEECGKPRFLTACPSCRKTLREYLPEIRTESVYEMLAEHKDLLNKDRFKEEVAVFHPCAAREELKEQESVKELIRHCGGTVSELSDPADKNGCCGYGGHIFYTNPGLYDKVSKKRADADERPYVTYCANCTDVLSDKGKTCVHILKLIETGEKPEYAKPATLSMRRQNRKDLKAHLEGKTETEKTGMILTISDECRQSMDRQLILESDIEAVICACEQDQTYLITDGGDYIGHRKLGIVTYWAVWKRNGEEVELKSAYSHRMVIEGE